MTDSDCVTDNDGDAVSEVEEVAEEDGDAVSEVDEVAEEESLGWTGEGS